MADVYAVDSNGSSEFYGTAHNDHELFKFCDDIEELGMEWDFVLH